ncbi:TetR/AcrR family transcriptional regulator [Sporolactobacillus sp. THM7-4]|nr:TetR/AcrR family transcriptional regulator [Sporolactobacillus sp. THM7-4]
MVLSKEETILNAAIREFAEKGFEQASTNHVAQLANTSKGLIFHYFGSKENLYEACVRHAINFTLKELDYENWPVTSHLIRDLRVYSEKELQFMKEHPDIYRLIVEAVTHPPEPLAERMIEWYADMKSLSSEYFSKMVNRLDLKENVDKNVLQAVIQSHINYYETLVLGYLKRHPRATMENLNPFIELFLDMLSLSLRGLVNDEECLLE